MSESNTWDAYCEMMAKCVEEFRLKCKELNFDCDLHDYAIEDLFKADSSKSIIEVVNEYIKNKKK